jgi:hypothetical protein
MEQINSTTVLDIIGEFKKSLISQYSENINTAINYATQRILSECAQDIAVMGDVYSDELKTEKAKREAVEAELAAIKKDYSEKYMLFNKIVQETIVRAQQMDMMEKAYMEKIAHLEKMLMMYMAKDMNQQAELVPRGLSPFSPEFIPEGVSLTEKQL